MKNLNYINYKKYIYFITNYLCLFKVLGRAVVLLLQVTHVLALALNNKKACQGFGAQKKNVSRRAYSVRRTKKNMSRLTESGAPKKHVLRFTESGAPKKKHVKAYKVRRTKKSMSRLTAPASA